MPPIDFLLSQRRTPMGLEAKAWTRYPVPSPPNQGYTHTDTLPEPGSQSFETHYLVRTPRSVEVYDENGKRLTVLSPQTLREIAS